MSHHSHTVNSPPALGLVPDIHYITNNNSGLGHNKIQPQHFIQNGTLFTASAPTTNLVSFQQLPQLSLIQTQGLPELVQSIITSTQPVMAQQQQQQVQFNTALAAAAAVAQQTHHHHHHHPHQQQYITLQNANSQHSPQHFHKQVVSNKQQQQLTVQLIPPHQHSPQFNESTATQLQTHVAFQQQVLQVQHAQQFQPTNLFYQHVPATHPPPQNINLKQSSNGQQTLRATHALVSPQEEQQQPAANQSYTTLIQLAQQLYKTEQYAAAKEMCKKLISLIELDRPTSSTPKDVLPADQMEVDTESTPTNTTDKFLKERLAIYTILAKINFKQSRFDRCRYYATQSLILDPNYAEAYKLIGDLHQQNSQLSHAIKNYRHALQLDHSAIEAKIQMSHCYYKNGDYQEAILNFHKVLNVYPELTDLYIYINKAYVKLNLSNQKVERKTKRIRNPSDNDQTQVIEAKRQIVPQPTTNTNPLQTLLIPQQAQIRQSPTNLTTHHHHPHHHQPHHQQQHVVAHNQNASIAECLNSIACQKRDLGVFDEAIRFFKQAIDLSPAYANAHSNLAATLQQSGRLHEALQHYQIAIKLTPNFPDAYSNMGNTLKELGEHAQAITCYLNAIQLNPQFVDAYSNLGAVYKDSGNNQMAIQAYTQALKLNPNFCDAYCNLVHSKLMICDWSNYDEQLVKIHQIIRDQLKKRAEQANAALWVPSVHPHHTMLYTTLCNNMNLEISKCHAQMAQQKIIGSLLQTNNRLASQTSTSKITVDEKYIKFYLNSISKVQRLINTETNQIDRALRIGFVSSDFGNHPTSHLTRSVFGELEKHKTCDVYCYALSKNDGTLFRRQIQKECHKMTDIHGLSAVDIATIISNDNIDILINMNGYTKGAHTELFALRPAPIQVMWLGYPGGSGAQYMDYLITDKVTTPRSLSTAHIEAAAYLNRSFFIGDHAQMFRHLNNRIIINSHEVGLGTTTRTVLHTNTAEFRRIETEIKTNASSASLLAIQLEQMCIKNDPMVNLMFGNKMTVINGTHILSLDKLSANGERCALCDYSGNDEVQPGQQLVKYSGIVTSRIQYGIPLDKVVFCNFNQLYKIEPSCVDMWCKILKNVPNSVIWLLRFPASGEINLKMQFQSHGIDQSRVIFTNVACKEEHCRRGCLADVCLDTVVCNGHTTGLDVLWTGCPMVTIPGKTFPSRVAAGQLACLGMKELIAQNPEDYVQIATKLGLDSQYRNKIRQRVWEQRTISPLFNVKHYAKCLNDVFLRMFKKYEQGFRKEKLPELFQEIQDKQSVQSVLNYINTQVDADFIDCSAKSS